MRVGVLSLQGAVEPHRDMLARLGVATVEVRVPADLDAVDALVVPGGESTAISKLLEANALVDPLQRRLDAGMPAFGTCAGMILLAADVLDGRPDQRSFAAIDIGVRRNAFGRQVDSFEEDLEVRGLDSTLHAVFIRAPVVDRVGPDVEVLATVDGRAVCCRQDQVVVSAFHPELSGDTRLHELFLATFDAGTSRRAG